MQYMVIERFRAGCVKAVYERVASSGRLLPDGVTYVNSWISDDLSTCYQIIECDDPALIPQWTARWEDLVAFEIVPVVDSATAAERVRNEPEPTN